jgi:4-hydroxy-2-oxoheptanedioate aldolase
VVVRGGGYGLVQDYVQRAHETLLIIPQIETVAAVSNAKEIASVPGVDMVFIGPADLSGSAGLPDQTGAPEVSRLIAQAESAVRAAGKPLATVPRIGKTWQDLFAEGYLAVAAASDLAMLRQGVVETAEAWRRYQAGGDNQPKARTPGESGPYS